MFQLIPCWKPSAQAARLREDNFESHEASFVVFRVSRAPLLDIRGIENGWKLCAIGAALNIRTCLHRQQLNAVSNQLTRRNWKLPFLRSKIP